MATMALADDPAATSQAPSTQQEIAAHPQDVLQSLESAMVDAVAACERSVVAITRIRKDQASRSPLESLRLAPGLLLTEEPTSQDFVPTFFGSGVVLSADGYIVTCAHVLDDPRRHHYFVWLDRRCYQAKVVGKSAQVLAADPFSDLAILKIEATDLSPLTPTDQPIRKGQLVIALGNPYAIARDGQASASWGILSNLQRMAPREPEQSFSETIHQLGTMLHTDIKAAVGSSGGALVDIRGRWIGLTTSLVAGWGQEHSAGLAIATDGFFQRVVEALKAGQQPEYGFLGIQPENLGNAEMERGPVGVRVSAVIPGLPGAAAGLRESDVIVQVGSQAVSSRNDLFRELAKVPTGQSVTLQVHRPRQSTGGQLVTLEAQLAKKFMATNRPVYSLHGPTDWRGAQVEYQTAIAGELERIAVARGGPKVAFLSVTPDSQVWRAGLRAGYAIISINGQTIQSPAQFHQVAYEISSQATLEVVANDGRMLTVVVAAEEP
jgi:serine protease Do